MYHNMQTSETTVESVVYSTFMWVLEMECVFPGLRSQCLYPQSDLTGPTVFVLK